MPAEKQRIKKLYKFYWSCGNMGYVDGLFIAEEEEVQRVLNNRVVLGDVLGQMSNIQGIITKEDLTIISDDQMLIQKLEEIFKPSSVTLCGFNPLDFFQKQE
jgi:hypothetical protein